MPGSGGATVLDDLPEWIIVEEILICLLPKDILRCRAVCRRWHGATSTDKFMLDNHHHQALLPILSHVVDLQKAHLLFSFDASAGQQKLCPVVRTYDYRKLQAVCDGLFIVPNGSMADEFICYPITRKYARLAKHQMERGFYHQIVGFYWHQPSGGEFRVLWISSPTIFNAYHPNYRTFYYVIVVGSDSTRYIRQGCITQPSVLSSLELVLRRGLPDSSQYPPVHHRGSLHWKLGKYHGCDADYIMVFNIAAETFRLMCRPARLSNCLQESLLEMDDTLSLCSICSDKDTIDFWVLHDYDTETWSFKNQIILIGIDPSTLVDPEVIISPRMAVLRGGEMLIRFTHRGVLHFDVSGKF